MNDAREQLLQAIGPALSFTQSRAAAADLLGIDLDTGRRLLIERLTGQREDGTLSLLSGTLSEGQAPSVLRVKEWRDRLSEAVSAIKADPTAYGVRLIDYERE